MMRWKSSRGESAGDPRSQLRADIAAAAAVRVADVAAARPAREEDRLARRRIAAQAAGRLAAGRRLQRGDVGRDVGRSASR